MRLSLSRRDIVRYVAAPTDSFGLVGNVIDGQFHVLEVIGEGGFSVVYKGQHLGLREPVAIKCLKIKKTTDPTIIASFTQRFFDESRISYRLSQGNLNIVRSITSGTTVSPKTRETVPYMVLEWLDGVSLTTDYRSRRERKLKGRPLAEVMKLFEPTAIALAYAHAQGIAHRDVKPGNLFLAQTADGVKLKVLDFGMAKVLDVGSVGFDGAATIASLMVISPQYSAPEQFEPTVGTIGAWTDVYSLALVMSEALTDRRARATENFGELMMSVIDTRTQPTPRRLGAQVSNAVEAVFAAALSVKPAGRQKDAGEFWRQLQSATLDVPDEVTRTDQALPDFGRTIAMPADLPDDVQQYLAGPSGSSAPTRQITSPMDQMPMLPPPQQHNQTLAMPGAQLEAQAARALIMARASAPPMSAVPQAMMTRPSAGPMSTASQAPPPSRQQAWIVAPVPPTPLPPPMPPAEEQLPQNSNTGLVMMFAFVALLALGVAGFVVYTKYGRTLPFLADPAPSSPAAMPASAPSQTSSAVPSMSASGAAIPSAAPSEIAPPPSHLPVGRATSANTALSMTDASLDACKQPGGVYGKGTAHVTFGTDGSVSQVIISSPPFAGTPIATCVADHYRAAKIQPFSGDPVSVEHVFEISK